MALKEKEHSKQQSKAELMLKASVQLKGRGNSQWIFCGPYTVSHFDPLLTSEICFSTTITLLWQMFIDHTQS